VKLRILDLAAIFASLAAVAGFSLYAYSGNGTAKQVVIESSGTTWIYQLDETRTMQIRGPLGVTTIAIGDGKAAVIDSPCPDKLCVLSGAISRPGQWVACLPNAVMMHIGGGSAEKLDDVSF
jgi:hypothetical protein